MGGGGGGVSAILSGDLKKNSQGEKEAQGARQKKTEE